MLTDLIWKDALFPMLTFQTMMKFAVHTELLLNEHIHLIVFSQTYVWDKMID